MKQKLRIQNSRPLTRLQQGHIVRRHDGEEWIVTYVNDCRAHIVPRTKQRRTFTPTTGPNAGKVREFEEQRRGQDISPNSEIDIIGIDREFLAALEARQNEQDAA